MTGIFVDQLAEVMPWRGHIVHVWWERRRTNEYPFGPFVVTGVTGRYTTVVTTVNATIRFHLF